MDQASVDIIVKLDKKDCGEAEYSSSSNNSNNSTSNRFGYDSTFTNNSRIMARNLHRQYPSSTNDRLTLKVMGLNSIRTEREWRLWEAIQNLQRSPGPAARYPNSPPPSPSFHQSFGYSPSSDCIPPCISHTPLSQHSSTSYGPFSTPSTDTMSDSRYSTTLNQNKNPFQFSGPCKDGIMDKKSHKRVIDMLRILRAYKVFGNTQIDGNVLKQRSMCYQLYIALFSF